MTYHYEALILSFFFFQAEDGIRDPLVTGVQTCALPISAPGRRSVGIGAAAAAGAARDRVAAPGPRRGLELGAERRRLHRVLAAAQTGGHRAAAGESVCAARAR